MRWGWCWILRNVSELVVKHSHCRGSWSVRYLHHRNWQMLNTPFLLFLRAGVVLAAPLFSTALSHLTTTAHVDTQKCCFLFIPVTRATVLIVWSVRPLRSLSISQGLWGLRFSKDTSVRQDLLHVHQLNQCHNRLTQKHVWESVCFLTTQA